MRRRLWVFLLTLGLSAIVARDAIDHTNHAWSELLLGFALTLAIF